MKDKRSSEDNKPKTGKGTIITLSPNLTAADELEGLKASIKKRL